MPTVRAFTPSWLSAKFPDGQSLFTPAASASKTGVSSFGASTASPGSSLYASRSSKPSPAVPGPRKTVARRGTEVFVASGREIRWADLETMKSAWEAIQEGVSSITKGASTSRRPVCRILRPPVADDIRQLIISPQANYMAILTAHTVHICVLPDSSHLAAAGPDTEAPLKTRFFTLGPTTHVTTRAPVVSAVWHPLGVNGSALVTVTRDAVVRLWEISPLDRWSFDAPTLAIDLKKLADGTSLDQDFGASTNTNAGYSPDAFDMEVAAACFGPRNSGGWSSMTLWVVMLSGDVYALCPLLPHRFAPPPTLIPSLSVAIVANVAALEDDADAAPRAVQLAQQQLDWMSQLDKQEPTLVEPSTSIPGGSGDGGEGPTVEVFVRPFLPSAVPRLQGPFELDMDDEEDETLCDIFVMGEKVDDSFLLGCEDEDGPECQELLEETDTEGLSLPVICLLSTKGRLRICLDLVGVEAQWLPPPPSSRRGHHAHKSSLGGSLSHSRLAMPDIHQSTARPLPAFQVVDVVRDAEKRPDGWCSFSPDVMSRYAFYITHPGGITYISLAPWVVRLEQELQEGSETGADFRLRQIVSGENTQRQRVYTHSRDEALAAAEVLRDPDLGYFLLSTTGYSPVAVCFDVPSGGGGGESDDDDGMQMPSLYNLHPSSSASVLGTPTPRVPHHIKTAQEEAEAKAVMALDFWKARPAFEIPPELMLVPSELGHAKKMLFSSRYQVLQHQEVKLSPVTLGIFTNTHKIVGRESGRLIQAVAQLFAKLEDLPVELHEQIESVRQLKQRIDMMAGTDVEVGRSQPGAVALTDDVRLRQRLQHAQGRSKELAERLERVRRAFHRASARPLSDKERAWAQEVQALARNLGETGEPDKGHAAPSRLAAANDGLAWRVKQVHDLWEDLSKQASAVVSTTTTATGQKKTTTAATEVEAHPGPSRSATASPAPSTLSMTPSRSMTSSTASLVRVPADVRKAKMAQVTKLLERETAMVEAMKERLERLGISA